MALLERSLELVKLSDVDLDDTTYCARIEFTEEDRVSGLTCFNKSLNFSTSIHFLPLNGIFAA